MTDAPERIWAGENSHGYLEAIDYECAEAAEYIRADVANALVAAAYEAASEHISSQSPRYADIVAWCIKDEASEILDLTPEDARKALDRIRADAREDGMLEAAMIADRSAIPIDGTPYSAGGHSIASKIRAEGTKK